jgi:hypothetical protein
VSDETEDAAKAQGSTALVLDTGGCGTHVIVLEGRYLLPYQGVPQALAATSSWNSWA